MIEDMYPRGYASKSIIWIDQISPNRRGGWEPREANIRQFSAKFYDRLALGSDPMLVLLVVLERHAWVVESVEAIISDGKLRNPYLDCHLLFFKDAGDRIGVRSAIDDFGLQENEASEALPHELVSRKLQGKVLCVSMDGKTSIVDSLRRAGFPDSVLSELFVEQRIPAGKNSNLMAQIGSQSGNHFCLLYAWEGLRTTTPDVKRGFQKCYEARSATKVVSLFKDWIVEGV